MKRRVSLDERPGAAVSCKQVARGRRQLPSHAALRTGEA